MMNVKGLKGIRLFEKVHAFGDRRKKKKKKKEKFISIGGKTSLSSQTLATVMAEEYQEIEKQDQ